jgi:Tfp pilus assembly major pilin PilA
MEANEVGREDLYRAAVGDQKADYYLPLFQKFDTPGASRISWNWPSVFVTFFWMIYRRMYGWAIAYYLLLPFVFLILASLLIAALGEVAGVLVYWILALAASFVAIPMYANALYHRSVNKRIEKLSVDAPSREAVVQRLIGQRSNMGVVVAVIAVGFIFIVGILAAIAIPAYQDYTIRSQVTEGLVLAAPVKEAVAIAYAESESWPADLMEAGLEGEEFRGTYVDSIEVRDGVVLIQYGDAAHASIAGGTLELRPASSSSGDVRWSCGYAETPIDAPATLTDIPAKYLPSSCRSP